MTASGTLADTVRTVRGVYGLSMTSRLFYLFCSILFGIALPPFFAFLIYSSRLPLHSWNADTWTVAILIPASAGMGFVIHWVTRVKWEFTDSDIAAVLNGRVTWRLAYADITDAEIRTTLRLLRVLWLHTARRGYSVVLSDPRLVSKLMHRQLDPPL